MSARILDGKAAAADVAEALRPRIAALLAPEASGGIGRPPGLAVVLVGDDRASAVYVRLKTRRAEDLGMLHRQVTLPASTTEAELLAIIDDLNADPQIDGILIQVPLPRGIDKDRVLDRVHPRKDVDGFHPVNTGRLWQRRPTFIPCTPAGVVELLKRTGVALGGKDAVVIGRSNIVGKPMVALLEQLDCTVTLAHSRTVDLAGVVGRADIVIAAVGVLEMVKGDWIKPGAIVIDVGVNKRDDGRLGGDVEFNGAAKRASWITPVPGGVGPMTIAMLMANTVRAAEQART
ncbi:MAG: bifunctional methylenetetrahydrofolate dehydrogenase/methenyltetrahydrofolate cyclohydrolase FolD [Myxococcales bacterium]|nr:bifunctional methylenetetrahydrofolate dehydrogenase/methenyltetrahydrofolate cyclohydrolase FolD [Myxococcales bacterium]